MGIFDRLIGRGGDQPNDDDENEEPILIQQYYFTDTNPEGKESRLDFDLIFGHMGPKIGWRIFRSNSNLRFADSKDWRVVIYEQGHEILHDEGGYKTNIGKLIPAEYIEREHRERYKIIDLPEKFTGVEIPEKSEWTDDELKETLMSIGAKDLSEIE